MIKKFLLFLLLFFVSYSLLSEVFFSSRHEITREIPEIKKVESILFIGDVMLGRYVETLILRNGDQFLFESINPLLFSSTYVIANLEGPLPEKHKQTPSQGFGFSFPQSSAKTLSRNHMSAVTLANNHSYDQGELGYVDTVKSLLSSNIAPFGHSRYFLPSFVTHAINGYSLSTIGINLITSAFNEEETILSIQHLCTAYPETHFVAYIHAGTEYTHQQGGLQVSFAHKLIDNTCIRFIVGSHPHVTQGIEKYKGRYIFYSLGNFIFDQYFSEDTQEGLVVSVSVTNEKLTFTLLPIESRASVPELAEIEKKLKILSSIASSSSKELQINILQGFLQE